MATARNWAMKVHIYANTSKRSYSDQSEVINDSDKRLTEGVHLSDVSKDIQTTDSNSYVAIKKDTNKMVKEVSHRSMHSNERLEAALILIKDGLSFASASRAVGVSAKMVSMWCKKNGIKPPRDQKRENARALIRSEQLSLSEIVKATELNANTISRLVREENVKLPHYGKGKSRIHPSYNAAVQDLQAGLQYAEVAKKNNVTKATVYKWAKMIGVCTKPNKPRIGNPRVHPAYSAAVQDLKSGVKCSTVAKKYNVGITAVYRWAEKAGVRRRGSLTARNYNRSG